MLDKFLVGELRAKLVANSQRIDCRMNVVNGGGETIEQNRHKPSGDLLWAGTLLGQQEAFERRKISELLSASSKIHQWRWTECFYELNFVFAYFMFVGMGVELYVCLFVCVQAD